MSKKGQQDDAGGRQHGRYGRGSYPREIHARVPEGIKDELAQLARRFGRDLSDEIRIAIYNHLRRHGMWVPGEELPPPRPADEVAAELEALAAEARQLIEEQRRGQGETPNRRSAAG